MASTCADNNNSSKMTPAESNAGRTTTISSVETSGNNDGNCNNNNNDQDTSATSSNQTNEIQQESHGSNNNQNNHNRTNDEDNHEMNTEQQASKDESSTFSTAFTISFEDENNANKKLSIKDSIRKFAPPKPHTIEKPRPPKCDQYNQDNSLASIESAPAGLAKHSSSFSRLGSNSKSTRSSSSRRTNSSKHSNISESAAFLIDKMLNCSKQQVDEEEECLASILNNYHTSSATSASGSSKNQTKKRFSPTTKEMSSTPSQGDHHRSNLRGSGGVNEIDFIEDKSDNGTYIVGADPESEAARSKIDELFGVVKAAEASIKAESAFDNARGSNQLNTRPSRLPEKKAFSKERQDHINRLASSSASISSSSSQHENNVSLNQSGKSVTKSTARNSRHSSSDRNSRIRAPNRNNPSVQRRSASQTSRQSSTKGLSDADTRSSKSSLHNEVETACQESPLSSHPNMKFNRAFALRRARLGLGEPEVTSRLVTQNQDDELTYNNLSSSQRRHQINTNTYSRAGQHSAGSSSNFARDDGGRFSLRMKNNNLSSRLHSAPHKTNQQYQNRSPQHGNLLESYMNKLTGSSKSGALNISTPLSDLSSPAATRNRNRIPPHSPHLTSTALHLPYQSSNDEFDSMSPYRYRLLMKTGRIQLNKTKEDFDNEIDKFNCLNAGTDFDASNNNYSEIRASSSIGYGRRTSALQLGALDSLVISAISSLSLKIRNSVCDVLVDHAKKLPNENETRMVVEEILPQLTADPTNPKSPTSVEEIDQSLYFDLAKTLKNLKKVEQMVDVINLISHQLQPIHQTTKASSSSSNTELNSFKSSFNTTTANRKPTGKVRSSDEISNQESLNDLSSV